ncbi:MAG: MYXO-CTERM sorting domain-containing protein [Myxococcaceae bacterium]
MRALLLLAVGLSACTPPGFSGDAGSIYFTTPLSRDYQSFTPWQPIAQGSHLTFKAEQVMPYSFIAPVVPNANATASGDALTTDITLPNLWSGWATAAGTGVVSWSGRVDDAYALTVAPAKSIELVDSLAYYADEGYTPHHQPFAAVGHELVVAPGGWVFLEAVPRSEGGVALAYEPGWLTVDADGGFMVGAGGHGVNIVAPASGPATSTFTLTAGDSGVSETFTLTAPADPSAEVARLELSVNQVFVTNPSAIFVVVATAYRADGGVLWVPPIEWTLSPGLVDLQTKNNPVFEITLPRRNDVRVVAARTSVNTVSASYAGLDASVTLSVPGLDVDAGTPQVAPPAPGSAPTGGCGCSSGSGALAALALLVVGVRRRRV